MRRLLSVGAITVAVTAWTASCVPPRQPTPEGQPAPVVTERPMAAKLAIEVRPGAESDSPTKPDAVLVVVNETERDISMVQPMIGLDTRVVMADSEVSPWNDSFVQVELNEDGWVTVKSHSTVRFDMSFQDALKWEHMSDGRYPCRLEYDDTTANRLATKRKLNVRSDAGQLLTPWFYVVARDHRFVRVELR